LVRDPSVVTAFARSVKRPARDGAKHKHNAAEVFAVSSIHIVRESAKGHLFDGFDLKASGHGRHDFGIHRSAKAGRHELIPARGEHRGC